MEAGEVYGKEEWRRLYVALWKSSGNEEPQIPKGTQKALRDI